MKFLSLLLLLLCGCVPTNNERAPEFTSDITNGVHGVNISVVVIGGHRFAVVESVDHVGICEVTEASNVKAEQ